jgi:uncharacterized protein (TIGR00645 family)
MTSNRPIIENKQPTWLTKSEGIIFGSRWLQAPLYVGLIIAQCVYVFKFIVELVHLVGSAKTLTENEVMLSVLALVDIVMIANLLLMVIVGGYETFVSRLYLEKHPDNPEWLSHVDAGILKIKLAMSLIGISSIHLLKTFINVNNMTNSAIFWQVVIHVVFIFSAYFLAKVEQVTNQKGS